MAKGTANVPDSDRCGLPLLRQRPVEGRTDGEKACVLSLVIKGKTRGLWEFSDIGPAPGPQPTAETARTCNQEGNVGAGLTPPVVGTSPVTLRVIEAGHTDASQPVDGLTETDLANLSAVLDHEVSRNTVTNYRAQWRSFMAWAQAKGIRGLPAEPKQVAAYLAERMGEHGHRPATLRTAASAIAFVHKAAGMDDPCASPEVKRTLRSATRRAGRSQKQAEALTEEAFAVIQSNACKPRRGTRRQIRESGDRQMPGELRRRTDQPDARCYAEGFRGCRPVLERHSYRGRRDGTPPDSAFQDRR